MPEPLRTVITYVIYGVVAIVLLWLVFQILGAIGVVTGGIFNIVVTIILVIVGLSIALYLLKAFGIIK